jgi:hypothetical protein
MPFACFFAQSLKLADAKAMNSAPRLKARPIPLQFIRLDNLAAIGEMICIAKSQ